MTVKSASLCPPRKWQWVGRRPQHGEHREPGCPQHTPGARLQIPPRPHQDGCHQERSCQGQPALQGWLRVSEHRHPELLLWVQAWDRIRESFSSCWCGGGATWPGYPEITGSPLLKSPAVTPVVLLMHRAAVSPCLQKGYWPSPMAEIPGESVHCSPGLDWAEQCSHKAGLFLFTWPLSVLACVSLSQSCSLPWGITRETGGCGWHLHRNSDN